MSRATKWVWAPIALSIVVLAGCEYLGSRDNAAQTVPPAVKPELNWKPTWEGPPATGPEKARLSPTIAFMDEWLGKGALTGRGYAQTLSAPLKEHFIDVFQQAPECRDVVLKKSMPRTADFTVQVFEGIDGRKGRWQWRMFRTDTGADMGNGEGTGDIPVTSICSTVRGHAFTSGGVVQ